MVSRRILLGGALSLAAARPSLARPPSLDPDADGEALWAQIQGAFDVDRTVINLNSGGCSPAPRAVHDAYVRDLRRANRLPPRVLWREQEPEIEGVRTELAREAGCDPEALAITRNASEALQIAQLGIDLKPGDEVIVSNLEYPRMVNTWAQRVRRDGIVVRTVPLSPSLSDPQQLVDAYAAAAGRRTRVVHVSHVPFMTGQVLPVAALCDWARQRGVFSIVDGAHAFAHVPVDVTEIGCDYYATSLHKWLMAPIGTGFLYVRPDRIAETWALQPAPAARDGDIRKFEAIGTHPAAGHNAIAQALSFHRQLGLARKNARLRRLRARWSDALRGLPGVVLHTPDDPRYGSGIGLVDLGGLPRQWVEALWAERILVQGINPGPFKGVRVSPNVFTTTGEIDRFVAVVRGLAQK